ncbi:MAG: UDP-3-O-(3-hydroxymyristoyl)glucosamine N-acyltransferase [Planctomycetota bacterium]|nr:UDP-3-O-(3-hydroxymyristoyl)glucosamine N-acyltransferase [Planctomycetota bacterium]
MSDCKTKEITLGELADLLGGSLTGDVEKVVRGVGALTEAGADEVAFLANVRYERFMAKTKAAAVIVAEDYGGPGENLIRCADPYFAFREAMVALYGFRRHPFSGIDPSARIDPGAKVAEDVSVAQFVTVEAGAQIGAGAVLYPGVFVGPDCRIGRGCILYPNVVLYDGTVLGERVTIHAGTVVGEDGFGYATHAGRHEKIPQAGWVEIGDDVEIGACCAIDRATMGATVIGDGTKFSNLVTIGHGTKVGKGCLFVAQVGVAGSTTIGDYCALAGQAGVVGHLKIGNNVRIGAKAGVTSDVPDGKEVLGAPAVPLAQARRMFSVMSRLPDLRRTLMKLEAEIAELKNKTTNAE